jgi:hypothetical protein
MISKKIKNFGRFLQAKVALAAAAILLLPGKILAQTTITVSDMPDVEVPTDLNIGAMLGKVQSYLFGAVIAACVFMVLWGGFDLATSGGDETKVTKAKNRILYASIGLVVAALSMGIVSLVMSIAGME